MFYAQGVAKINLPPSTRFFSETDHVSYLYPVYVLLWSQFKLKNEVIFFYLQFFELRVFLPVAIFYDQRRIPNYLTNLY